MRISGFYDLGGRKPQPVRIRAQDGDDRDILIRCLDANDAVVDITGATPIEFHVARSKTSTREIAKDLSDGIVITNATAGEFTVSLVPADTQELTGNYLWEAEVTLSSKLRTVAQGRFSVIKGVGDAN